MAGSEPQKRSWTVIDLITWGTEYLDERRFTDARLNVELLLGRVLGLKRIQLYTGFDRPLTDEELARFKELFKRRLAHEPVQYILGETEFMGLPFAVSPRVLIPRPDTEVLIESVLQEVKRRFAPDVPLSILDIGTGSGCMAVSLAAKLPQASVTATDVSPDAIVEAEANALRNGVRERVRFVPSDVLTMPLPDGPYHVIVSNPPYISAAEYSLLAEEVRRYEPSTALTDAGDGLSFYRAIAQRSGSALLPEGFIAVEHAYDQSDAVREIFSAAGLARTEAVKDYEGHWRCVVASREGPLS